MKSSPAIFVTTPTSPTSDSPPTTPVAAETTPATSEHMQQKSPTQKASLPDRSPGASPGASRLSFLNVDGDSNRRLPQTWGGSMAAIRRHTVMLARDVLLRRFSRNEASTTSIRHKVTLEEFEKLVHEVNQMVATYRQVLQTIGTHLESSHTRKELSTCRRQCHRHCESAKNCILPLLKDDGEDLRDCNQNSETARHHSHQFIGCLNMFITEMKRTQSLILALSPPTHNIAPSGSASCPEAVTDGSSYVTAGGSSLDVNMVDELDSLSKDLQEAEAMLETLENAITIHFSIEPRNTEHLYPAPKVKRNCQRYSKFCVHFKTNYA